jgi:hypothetical protein
MALGLIQPLTEMSTSNISCAVKTAGTYHLHVPIIMKSGSPNPSEPSGPLQICNEIALNLANYCERVLMVNQTSKYYLKILISGSYETDRQRYKFLKSQILSLLNLLLAGDKFHHVLYCQ